MLFIVSEGVNTGIIELSYTGEFLGYFTSNKTRLTPQQAFLKAIYTKEQEEKSALLNTRYSYEPLSVDVNLSNTFIMLLSYLLVRHILVKAGLLGPIDST